MFRILKIRKTRIHLKKANLRYLGLAESARRISYFHRFINFLKDVGDSGSISTFWL